jgi:hypothetical protein
MKVTRQVISDLWPIYAAGEATSDTRALVDEFLATDPDFARTLRAEVSLPNPDMRPTPNAEVEALRRTRDLVHGRSWLRGLRLFALAMTVFAVTRALTDVQWADTPRRFVAESVTAIAAWTLYAFLLRFYRTRSLQSPRK